MIPSWTSIVVHASQYPDAVRRELLEALRTGKVPGKFLYDSPRLTQKWLALHQAFSPLYHDPACRLLHEEISSECARRLEAGTLSLVGLGCGSGAKDLLLAGPLQASGRAVSYVPVDVSQAMVLTAMREAVSSIPPERIFPVVMDLAHMGGLDRALLPDSDIRVFTLYGVAPNFEPDPLFLGLSQLVLPGEYLLFGTNLAEGGNYQNRVREILPQYDNPLTRAWLMAFLHDYGVDESAGALAFSIDERTGGIARIVARFVFSRGQDLLLDSESIAFDPGKSLELFFSIRYTRALLEPWFLASGFDLLDSRISRSGEEGVFLLRRR